MRRISPILVLALACCPMLSFADDKKETRSLTDEAAYLAANNGKDGWASDEVEVSRNDGSQKAKVILRMVFKTDKDKPTGELRLGMALPNGADVLGVGPTFELVEKDGKRSIRISFGNSTNVVDYTLDGDKLTVKGGVIHRWAGWDVDLTNATAFKPGVK
ncbi:MAG TPA: hypothetical protein VMS17_23885 [Gemmataceae bacterium]|nr:hypothetical protein [Gemmataceae bacterium]